MKKALITGSSRGIGRAIAIKLHEKGYKVFINYSGSAELAENLAHELNTIAIKADVSDFTQVEAMFKETGDIDLLVNNAGIAFAGLITDTSAEQWRKLFAVNVDGVFNCTKAAVPYMIREKCGTIINISSICGTKGASYESAYSATKGAILSFSTSLAKELAPSGIRVNVVAPGVIETDMMGDFSDDERAYLKQNIGLNRFGTPEDVANIVAFLASDEASYITGQIISPDGGFIM